MHIKILIVMVFQNVVIEIERHSNQKYEYNRNTDQMELDRVLPYPYFYPYAYGFIPETRAGDGDEIDVLVVTENECKRGDTVSCYIVGALEMEDEKGMDIKLIALPETEYHEKDIGDLPSEILENIKWFFTHYKSKDLPTRWSKVGEYVGRAEALQYYHQSLLDNVI
jgi:inorganic pyrophosphatase